MNILVNFLKSKKINLYVNIKYSYEQIRDLYRLVILLDDDFFKGINNIYICNDDTFNDFFIEEFNKYPEEDVDGFAIVENNVDIILKGINIEVFLHELAHQKYINLNENNLRLFNNLVSYILNNKIKLLDIDFIKDKYGKILLDEFFAFLLEKYFFHSNDFIKIYPKIYYLTRRIIS